MSTQARDTTPAPTIHTVDICIVYENEVLMLRRSATKKAFPNCLALPGGHIEDGEDPFATAIRETHEETGISIDPSNIQLKFIANHHHTDRNETYMIFGFLAIIPHKPTQLTPNDEGTLQWVNRETLLTSDTIFPPVQYYCDHLLNKKGILYTNIIWEHSTLREVLSEHTDSNS